MSRISHESPREQQAHTATSANRRVWRTSDRRPPAGAFRIAREAAAGRTRPFNGVASADVRQREARGTWTSAVFHVRPNYVNQKNYVQKKIPPRSVAFHLSTHHGLASGIRRLGARCARGAVRIPDGAECQREPSNLHRIFRAFWKRQASSLSRPIMEILVRWVGQLSLVGPVRHPPRRGL